MSHDKKNKENSKRSKTYKQQNTEISKHNDKI